MDLFTLAAKLTLDSSKFTSGIQDAEKKSDKLTKTLNKAKTVVKAVAGAAVIGKATSSLKEFAQQAASAGDKIDKQSQALGISRKAYQEWDYILSQNGSSIDSLGTSMKTLNTAILNGKDSVKKLGISYEQLQGMSMEEQFEAVVKAMQDMPESAEKSALAVELFGKNGMQLLPLLNSSATSVDELKKKFSELGIEMSDSQIDNAVHYTDAMDTLQRTFDGIKIAIGSELLPVMTDWANKAASYAGKLLKAYKEDGLLGVFKTLDEDISTMTKKMRDSGNPVLQALADIIDTIKEALKIVVGLFTDFPGTVQSLKESDSEGLRILGSVLETIKGIFDWIVEHKREVILAISGIIAAFAVSQVVSFVQELNPLVLIFAAIAAAALLIIENWEPIQKFFEDMWSAIQTAVTNAWDEIKKWWEDAVKKIKEAWDGIAEWFGDLFEHIEDFFNNLWDVLSNLWTGITNIISGAWNTVAGWFNDNVFKPIGEFFKPVWEFISKLWKNITTMVSNAWKNVSWWFNNSVWQPIKSKFEPVWNVIKQLWDGVLSKVSLVWTTVKSVFEKALKPIKDAFESVQKVVQNVIDKIREFFGLNVKTTVDSEGNKFTDYGNGFYGGDFTTSGGGGGGERSLGLLSGHAKGDWSVPYDDYIARLHRGEMVLTASQARKYRDGEESGINVKQLAQAVVVAIREGMNGVTVDSYLDGNRITDDTNHRMLNDLKSRRFVNA